MDDKNWSKIYVYKSCDPVYGSAGSIDMLSMN